MPAIPSARRNRIYENRNSDFICIEPYSLERNSTSAHQFHFYKGGPNDENIKLHQFRNCDPVYSSSSSWLDAGTQIATSESSTPMTTSLRLQHAYRLKTYAP